MSGFDPLTATDDELATWTAYVTEAHKATACPKSSADHTTGGPDHTYTYAKARWKVPSVYVPGDDKAYYSSSWVGIGQSDSKSKPPIQDGSESDEWVYERPDIDGYYPHPAYATTTFTDAYAEYGSTMKSLGNLAHDYVTM